MANHKGNADAIKEEVGWLKVLFAVLAAIDAPLVAWFSQSYMKSDRVVLVPAGVMGVAAFAALLWINYAAYRKIGELKSLS